MDDDTRKLISHLKAVAINHKILLEESPIGENSSEESRAKVIERVSKLIERVNSKLLKVDNQLK